MELAVPLGHLPHKSPGKRSARKSYTYRGICKPRSLEEVVRTFLPVKEQDLKVKFFLEVLQNVLFDSLHFLSQTLLFQ